MDRASEDIKECLAESGGEGVLLHMAITAAESNEQTQMPYAVPLS